MGKKILILSCNTGEGHNSAARAVMEAAEACGCSCSMADPMSFGSDTGRKTVTSSLNGIAKRAPNVFGVMYKTADMYSRSGITSPVYLANALYAENLNNYITSGAFDIVLCTHLFAMEALTFLRKRKDLKVPALGVLTDYTCIPFLEETRLNGYFIPHRDLTAELVSRGVEENAVYPTGIPTNPVFKRRMSRFDARNYLGMEQSGHVFVIMTGGVGCGDTGGMCDRLTEEYPSDFQAYVLVGKNDEMKNELDKRFESDKRIVTVPFTSDVDIYMKAADVLITKPGGISSTEAAVAGVPMVHAMAIPGCETKNAAFFASHGMSLFAETEREAAALAAKLASDKTASEKMINCQKENINPDAAGEIVNILIKAMSHNMIDY